MNPEPLVTMITYCYNGERFVSKYFDAILAQTYSNIELFFYDNGSTDATGVVAQKYRRHLEEKGIQFNLLRYKQNQTGCRLKQQAFHMMHGDYFFGCDSDDIIDPTYIEEMVGYLKGHPDKGIVYCQLRKVREETDEMLGILKMQPRYEEKEAFLDILKGTNINFTAISYMMSRRYFEMVNPTKSIYDSRYGENYQIQMPFLYHDLQGYIEKPLGQYTVRSDSYSSGLKNYEKKYEALKGQEKSVLATLEQIQPDNIDYYKRLFLKRIRREQFYTALYWNNTQAVKESYSSLKEIGRISQKDRASYIFSRMHLFIPVCNIINKTKK